MTTENVSGLRDSMERVGPLLRGAFEKENLTSNEVQDLTRALDSVRVAATVQREGRRKRKKGDLKGEVEILMREADDLGIKLHHAADELKIKLDLRGGISDYERNGLMAALWHTVLRLIHFSTPLKPSISLSMRLLSVVSHTMEALIDVNDIRPAGESALIGAEALESLPKGRHDMSSGELEQWNDAEIDFYMARSKLAVLDTNDTLALDFLRKASSVAKVPSEEQALRLADRYLSIVDLKKRTPSDQAAEGTYDIPPSVWLEEALGVLKTVKENGESQTLLAIKVSGSCPKPRENLKTAGEDVERLTRAAELLESIEKMIVNHKNSAEHLYEVRILKIQVLKNQKSPEGAIRHAFDDLIKELDLNEDNLNEVFAQLRAMTKEYPDLPLDVTQTFLNLAYDRVPTDQQWILDRILYEGILFARTTAKVQPRAAIQTVTKMCDVSHIPQSGQQRLMIPVSKLLWNLGAAAEKKPSRLAEEAAEWYLLAGHPGFSVLGIDHIPRCLRKSALCRIQTNNIEGALELLHMCPQREASTHYLFFLAAMSQSTSDGAGRAIEDTVTCPDVDGRHLMLITSLAESEKSHSILMSALQALLATLQRPHSNSFIKVELVSIVREGPLGRLVQYLQTTVDALSEDVGSYREQVDGVSWLYKSAHNMAMRGMDENVSPGLLGDLFNLSARLMDFHVHLQPELKGDEVFQINRSAAMFACFCGKLFQYRDLAPDEKKQSQLLDQLLGYLPACQQAVPVLPSDHQRATEMDTRSGLMELYYLELLCEAQSWDEVDAQSKSEYPDCPMEILYFSLDELLRLCTISTAADVVRFSRWIRSTITLLLDNVHNTTWDGLVFFFKKAMTVLSSPLGSKSYPQDELEWLLVTAWNKSLQASQHGYLQEGLKWCELAMDFNDFTSQPARHRETLRIQQ
ncbi:hypothetical protein IAU59_007466 [Kwoniella sp. CBS 9459]